MKKWLKKFFHGLLLEILETALAQGSRAARKEIARIDQGVLGAKEKQAVADALDVVVGIVLKEVKDAL